MRLADLPTMVVERMESSADGVRVHGRFDRLEGVATSGYFRLARCEYVWTDLSLKDGESGAVVVTDARDPAVSKLQVGERYTWLDDYWQAPLVEAIADESTEWHQFTFEPSDAQYFRQGDSVGWRKAGSGLPDGAVALEVKAGGWDHEHCDLCGRHIDASAPTGYSDSEEHFLCAECYERYGRHHDLSFQVGA